MILVISAAALTARAAIGGQRARRPKRPPFELVVSAPDTRGHPWLPAHPAGLPQVILYVSPKCPHCHAELDEWNRLALALPGLAARVAIVIVTPAPAEPSDTSFIPARLRHRRIWDRDRRIGRALQLRAVPASVYLSPRGVVRHLHVGRSRLVTISRRLDALAAGKP
ncbi:MAG: hypothetical protein ABR543_01595 [Gemmatimonadaceae bacterium]